MTTEKEMAKEMTVMTMTLMMQDMWEDVKMRVPALAPSNLGGVCNIMQVRVSFKWLKYHLKPLHEYEVIVIKLLMVKISFKTMASV